MKNTTNTTTNNIKLHGLKAQEINEKLLNDLQNKSAMFWLGFVDYAPIHIKKLSSNKPADIKAFDSDMLFNENDLRFFYIVEIDREKATQRYFSYYKDLIICDFLSDGKCSECTLSPTYERKAKKNNGKYLNYNFKNIERYWRKSDYEEARKCAKNIYCIYQRNHAQEIANKQEQRKQAKQGAQERFIKFDIQGEKLESYYKLNRLYATDGLGNTTIIYNYYAMWSYERLTFDKKEQAKAYFFDASGYYSKDNQRTLKARLEMLKKEKDRQAMQNHNHSEEIELLNGIYCELLVSFKRLSDFFIKSQNKGEKMRVFWFAQRMETTTTNIYECAQLLSEIENKTIEFESLAKAKTKERYNKAKKCVLLNDLWLNIPAEERSNENNLKDNAIYYGYCTEATDNNGLLTGVCLDLEKMAEKLKTRGY